MNVEGNILLDYSFVNWYVRTHYNFSIEQCESYEIVLIDDSKNVTNMSNISYIELSNKKYNAKGEYVTSFSFIISFISIIEFFTLLFPQNKKYNNEKHELLSKEINLNERI